MEEFAQLCCCASNQQKHPTKSSSQLQSRGHQGLIIYVSRFDQQGRECAVSKMNFLDLAGLFFSCVHHKLWLVDIVCYITFSLVFALWFHQAT